MMLVVTASAFTPQPDLTGLWLALAVVVAFVVGVWFLEMN
jgi:Sec-independent protein secretion pathway component TatC